jgi:thiol-disulfide isomerase/thioredoxin
MINYGEDNKTIIFGVSLDKRDAGKERPGKEVPADVRAWLDKELENAKVKEALPDYTSDLFFNFQPARLVGYMKGYDPRLGFSTGIIYNNNVITGEDFPITLNIYPNGRFEADIPMSYPTFFYLLIKDKPFIFYLEPGQTLAVIVDWEEFLIADRLRNIQYTFKNIEFIGPLSEVNSELYLSQFKMDDWKRKEKRIKTMKPDEYKAFEQQSLDEKLAFIRQKSKEHSLSEKSVARMTIDAHLIYGYSLFDYLMYREMFSREDSTNQVLKCPVPDNYYDFLLKLPLNDQSILISNNIYRFINRFEFCRPFTAVNTQFYVAPDKTFFQYLKEEHQEKLTEEDEQMKEIEEKLKQMKDEKAKFKYYEANRKIVEAFYQRHETERNLYNKKYIEPQSKAHQKEQQLKEIQLRDSILTNVLHLSKPNLIYDIAKVRRLNYIFKNIPVREDAEAILVATVKDIQNPVVVNEAGRIFIQAFPENEKTSYVLPETIGGKLFREMIAPFKGKYIVVDFWESSCGPCMAGIKKTKPLREKLKNDSNIAFLFICSEDTPEDTYKQYGAEQGLVNSHRLTKDDFIRMRELLRFNGIPHYEYVNREGEIMNKGLDVYNLESSLNELLRNELKSQNQNKF